jgi:hypothetical protein
MTVHDSLTRQAHRCVDHLSRVDPGSHEFNMTLENMERLMAIRQFMAECLDTDHCDMAPESDTCDTENVVKLDPIEEVHPVAPAPVFEETTEPTPFDPVEKTYSKEEVRAALGAARAKGINVTELMKKFGVEKFPAFPAGKYGELMDMLEGMMT